MNHILSLRYCLLVSIMAAFSFLTQGCMGTSGFIVEDVKVDQELVENLSREDALIMIKTLIRAHAPLDIKWAVSKHSDCKVSDEGVAGAGGNFVPFDQLSLSYEIESLDALNFGPAAKFTRKNDGTRICSYSMDVTTSSSRSKFVFDWQQRLLTPSVIVLGGEFSHKSSKQSATN